MSIQAPPWVVEQDEDGWWSVNGEGAPSFARAMTPAAALEVAAEEAKRLEIDPQRKVVFRDKAGSGWDTTVEFIVQDYGMD